ncbi:MAG: hypothetical protein VX966_08310 [Chloroflexota bacterium]|nr:hypothetical protein [Chloroflexota bacterium]
MAGPKEKLEVRLNVDHVRFAQSMMEKHQIRDEAKVLRIIMDYVITSPTIHDDIFTEVRCLRCG